MFCLLLLLCLACPASASQCARTDEHPGSLMDLVASGHIRNLLVGGKGGVGKTTVASAVALKVAKTRDRKVLLVSTDPAHSIGDAFNVSSKMGSVVQIPGTNLWLMELDCKKALEEEMKRLKKVSKGISASALTTQVDTMADNFGKMPGADEVAAIAEVLEKYVAKDGFEFVVFDTAPTGHTLRMLQTPKSLIGAMTTAIDTQAAGMSQLDALEDGPDSPLGPGGKAEMMKYTKGLDKYLKSYRSRITKVQKLFEDRQKTEFLVVTMAEPLAVSETGRLIKGLGESKVAASHVVCNQLIKVDGLTREDIENAKVPQSIANAAGLAVARAEMQAVHLAWLKSLDGCLDVIEAPLLHGDVVGVAALERFGEFLAPGQPRAATAPKHEEL